MVDSHASSCADLPGNWEKAWIDFEELPRRIPSVMLGDQKVVPVQRAWLSERQGRWRLREWSSPFPGVILLGLVFAAYRFYRARGDNEQARIFFDRAQDRNEVFSQLKLGPSRAAGEAAVFEPPYVPWQSALSVFGIVVGVNLVFNLWGLLRPTSFSADGSRVVLGRKNKVTFDPDQIQGVYQVSGKFNGRFRAWDIQQIGLLWRTDEGAVRMRAIASVYDSARTRALGQELADVLGVELLSSEAEPDA
ncbi:MAG: hypothetical protein CMJ94_13560 [Planctomycetes bacterium]|nr:hypothetical protein [Planctomycetota bacterium]